LCDQDDVWLCNKVETVISAFNADTSLVVHNAFIGNDSLKIGNKTYFETIKPSKSMAYNLVRNTLIGAMMAFPRSLLVIALPFPKEIGSHDIWLGLVAGSAGNIEFVNEPLMYYRRHSCNASPTLAKSQRPIIKRCKERIFSAYQLIARLLTLSRVPKVQTKGHDNSGNKKTNSESKAN